MSARDAANKLDFFQAIRTDSTTTTGTTYVGFACSGTLNSEAKWIIFKLVVTSGDVATTWPNGDRSSVFVWDDRVGYTYV